MILKCLPTDCPLVTREKNSNSPGEKSHTLDWVIKVNLTSEGQMDIKCLQTRRHPEKDTTLLTIIWPGDPFLNLILKKIQDKYQKKNILLKKRDWLLKKCQVLYTKALSLTGYNVM